jgi:hypothetical protein
MSKIYQTVKFASVNATSDGDNEIVAAVSGKKIRVLGYCLTSNAAGTVALKSGASTTLARIRIGADGDGAAYAGSAETPAFETAAGEALNLNNPASVDTFGHLCYMEE